MRCALLPDIHRLIAASAVKVRGAAADGYQGDEKQADVVIRLLSVGLIQPALRTTPCRRINGFRFGLHPCDEEAHNESPHTILLVVILTGFLERNGMRRQ